LTVMSATRFSTWTSTGSDTLLSLTTALFAAVLEQVVLGVVHSTAPFSWAASSSS
jgi:hypothetical protein